MKSKYTYTTGYDTQRKIGRIEVFDGERCVASRVAHDLKEVALILKDFEPLIPLGEETIWGIQQAYAIKGMPDKRC